MRPVLAFILFLLLIPAVGSAATIHVPGDYGTIQAAIDASSGGDVIIVDSGTYYENIDFKGKAITVESASGASATFIDGGQAGSAVTFDSGEGAGSILDGFTVKNGFATFGGGIYCNNSSSPTLLNLVIDGNSAAYGGGISVSNGDLVITGSNFTNNTADFRGGGLYADTGTLVITNCDFDGNTVDLLFPQAFGGAIYAWGGVLTVKDSRLFENRVGGSGGAIYFERSSLILTGNSIYQNSAASDGGGVYCNSAYNKDATLKDNIIHDNTCGAERYGGGLFLAGLGDVTLVNNIVYDNEGGYGGGLYLGVNNSSTITNNTFSQNTADTHGRGIYGSAGSNPVITNTIIWDGSASTEPAFYFVSGTAAVTYSDIEGGAGQGWFGTGCIDTDPLFADSASGDFHLASGSPCIDTGDNSAPSLPPYDIEGNDRVGDGDNNGTAVVDMGAYEYQYPTLVELISFTATGCDQRIAVAWETASEENCAGFHLWRSVSPDPTQGGFIRITGKLIPSRGGPSIGAEYSFIDGYVVPGRTYFYKLEVMDFGCASTFYGPVSMKWWKPRTGHF